jgi:hypothetical protein
MAIFGNTGQRPTHWLKTGLAQARRVGRVESRKFASGIGSGFVVNGSVFGQAFDRLPVFVTAGHVIGGIVKPIDISVPASDVTIVFEGMFDDASPRITAECHHCLIDSPVDKLNYTLVLLNRWPGTVPDLLLAPRRPKPGAKIFVISYPLARGLAIALDDNEVVGNDDVAIPGGSALEPASRLLYRAPTEPGSSGGPVFNENWEIVGIHNGGANGMMCNFGAAFDAVVLDARSRLAGESVPNDLADAIRATARAGEIPQPESDPNYFSVFISYSHADSVFANRLYNSLQARGVRAWLDKKQMRPGDDIYEEVQKGIQLWDKVLLCASKASLTSWWVDSEIDRVFQKERNLFKERKVKVRALVPLQLDDFLFTQWESGKAQEVKSRIAADFRGWEDQKQFETKFEVLVSALRADAGAREAPPVSKL